MKKLLLVACALGSIISASLMATSCSKSSTSPMTLYDSLGGTTMVSDPAISGAMIEKGRLGIRSVVDSTIFVIAADTALNNKFFVVLLTELGSTPSNTTGLTALEKNFTDFVCVATGSKNFTYSGKSMTAAHDPAQNSRMHQKAASTDFDKFVTDLVAGATKCGLSSQLIGQVGTVVNSVKSQVVQQ